jgi:hypothetical protein
VGANAHVPPGRRPGLLCGLEYGGARCRVCRRQHRRHVGCRRLVE